jgi:hypothetical protein
MSMLNVSSQPRRPATDSNRNQRGSTMTTSRTHPVPPPRNPFLADSSNCIVHANSAQTDSTVDPGPVGPTRTLGSGEMRYHDLGMFNLAYLISGQYPDGKRTVWTNGSQFITKFDYRTFDVIASLRLPDSAHTDGLDHENWLDVFDSDAALDEKLPAAKESGFPQVAGVYALLDTDNQYVMAGSGFVRVYGDETRGERLSGIALRAHWDKPSEITGGFIGINTTFDGHIVLGTEDGYVLTLKRDLSDFTSIRLPHAADEVPHQPHGVAWIRNGFAVDEHGGIYVASQHHLHKIVWDGTNLSTDTADGAWSEPYSNSLGRGSGSTPTLVGFGDEPDKLVVLTDGDVLMNVTAYWRDDIPSG